MKGSKKFICPSCGQKKFVPYVDENNNIVDIEKWGRCERKDSCGYCEYPKIKGNEWQPQREPKPYIPPKPTEYVSQEIVEKTFNNFKANVFFQYLIRTFPLENIGVLVFLQIPGLIVSRDLNLFLFVLADFYDVAIKQSGFIV